MKSRPGGAALLLLFTLLIGLVPVAPVWAEGAYSVSGHVTREGGGSLDAAVAVQQTDCDEGCFADSIRTEPDGSYVISGLGDGEYELDVSDNSMPEEYAPQARSVTIAGGSETDQDVMLYQGLRCEVSITGTYRVGQVLTANREVTPANTVYAVDATNTSWAATGAADDATPVDIPDSTSETYALTEDELGKHMYFYQHITAPNRGSAYCQSSVTSPVVAAAVVVTDPVPPTPVPPAATLDAAPPAPFAAIPVVTGRARKGRTVVAGVGSPPAGTIVSYQWLRVTKVRGKKHKVTRVRAIAGATGATYRLTRRDVGRAVCVQVSYTRAGSTPTVLRSSPTRVR